MTAVEVSTATDLDQVAIHRAVSSLLGRGLVSRKQDAADKRRKPLSVTPEGAHVYAEIVPFALDLQKTFLAPLNEEEQKQLWVLVRKLSENL